MSKKISLNKSEVPNTNFPGAEFGIPQLDLEWQADCIDQPVVAWGGKSKAWRASRAGQKSKTYHFYVDDHLFSALLKHPETALQTVAPTFVEANFSLHSSTPRWRGLHIIGQKRWISRYWQQFGRRRILVDLNVPSIYAEDNLIGVPRGWRAYATRASEWELPALIERHEIAMAHAGTNRLIFLAYGGGKQVQAYCQTHGLEYVPNEIAQYHKKS